MRFLSKVTDSSALVNDLALAPLSEHLGKRRVGRLSHWMSRLSLIMLLLACANAASLLLARGLSGRYEAGVRKALGVSQRRLFVQLLTEPVLLAFLGGLGAVALTYWAGHFSRSFLAADLPWPPSPLHPRLLLFTLGVSVLTGLAAGLLPAFFLSRQDSLEALKRHDADSGRNSNVQVALVGVQCALSLLLLVAAGLFTTSLARAYSTDLGFDHGNVVALKLEYGSLIHSHPDRVRQLSQRVRRSLQARERVRALSFSTSLPFYRLHLRSSDPRDNDAQGPTTFTHYVDEGFFTVMGVRFLRGRPPSFQPEGPYEVVVSESLARLYASRGQPLGQCLAENSPQHRCRRIVGVVPDMRLHSLSGSPPLQYFLPLSQYPAAFPRFLLLRLKERRPGEAERLRRLVLAADNQLRAVHVIPLDRLLQREIRPWKSAAKLFAFFAALALLVAMLGLYSVLTLNVAGRRRELSIRAVLGARADNQLALIFGEALRLSWAGIGAGVFIALGSAGLLEPMLFKTSARHPLVLTAAVVLLLSAATLTAFIPAWRAARVDPSRALRD
ncbi:MAG TPA: FtsX-like permease family protein [Acidobacteriota bacterium]|nr:FtsX-like permease family protein [Acidobacteriota bacterium]